MALPSQRKIRLTTEDEEGFIAFGDEVYEQGRDFDYLLVRSEDLPGCKASELEAAFAAADVPKEAFLTDDTKFDYDDVESPALDIRFEELDGVLVTRIEFRLAAWIEWDNEVEVQTRLAPLLHHHHLSVHKFDPVASTIGWLYLDHQDRDMDLGALLSAARDVLAFLDATRGGELTMKSAAFLVKAGRVDALVGRPENYWFDAKTTHYDLQTVTGKVSLAQAVARFCNGDGGIIVFGLATSIKGGIEIVSKVAPLPSNAAEAVRYRQIIDQYVYPFPEGLTVTAVDTSDGTGMVLLVEIPPQPEYNKPFLVTGAILDNKVKGDFLSVVQRRDDGSEHIKAATLHSWIVTGRALIQRGELPGEA